jgi:rubrerythrin
LDVDRRRFLNLAGLSGAALFLAACGDEKTNEGQGPIAGEKPQDAAPERAGSDVNDVNVLNSALDLEHQAVAAYTAAFAVLRGANLRAARTFRDQERQHAVRLAAAIKAIGGRPNAARDRYAFPRLRDEQQVLRFASQLENTAIAAYIDALPRLNDADMRATGAAILANEGEHLAVLNQALGERAAPDAFVTGSGVSR